MGRRYVQPIRPRSPGPGYCVVAICLVIAQAGRRRIPLHWPEQQGRFEVLDCGRHNRKSSRAPPYGSKIRQEDDKKLSAILMRTLQTHR
jgi:hypothetical protein